MATTLALLSGSGVAQATGGRPLVTSASVDFSAGPYGQITIEGRFLPTSPVVALGGTVLAPVLSASPTQIVASLQSVAGIQEAPGDYLVVISKRDVPYAEFVATVGEVGPAGPRGRTGAKGEKGDTGPQGLNGPIGPTGQNGSPGPTGPAGAMGPVGPAGLQARGAWDGSTSGYVRNDVVTRSGQTWRCVAMAGCTRGNEPSGTNADWELLAAKGAEGPTGPPGTPGLTGATGPVGPTGPIGPEGPPGTATGGAGEPVGALLAYAGSTAPAGWLLADGSAVGRATYPALFAAIGTTYGAGDFSTTFNLPDLRGRIAVGVGSNPNVTLGNSDSTSEPERQPLHTHLVPPHSHGLGSLGVATAGSLHVTFNYESRAIEPCHNSGIGCEPMARSVSGGGGSGPPFVPVSAFTETHAHGLSGRAGSTTGADGDGPMTTAASAPSWVVVNYLVRAQ